MGERVDSLIPTMAVIAQCRRPLRDCGMHPMPWLVTMSHCPDTSSSGRTSCTSLVSLKLISIVHVVNDRTVPIAPPLSGVERLGLVNTTRTVRTTHSSLCTQSSYCSPFFTCVAVWRLSTLQELSTPSWLPISYSIGGTIPCIPLLMSMNSIPTSQGSLLGESRLRSLDALAAS